MGSSTGDSQLRYVPPRPTRASLCRWEDNLPWANMCKPCFEIHGVGLGLGMGQELLLEPPSITEDEDLDTDDCGVPKDVIVGLWEGLPVILDEEGE